MKVTECSRSMAPARTDEDLLSKPNGNHELPLLGRCHENLSFETTFIQTFLGFFLHFEE